MRRAVVVFFVANLLLVGFLVRSVSTLLRLLVEDGSADAIHRAELPVPDVQSDLLPQIPKIIHQTYINDSIPARWEGPRRSCLDLHEDYEYMMWTDEKSRRFIAAEYPAFLHTYDSYPQPIQRADVIRYFVLAHYGGIYIDLDDGCNRRLDPLLSYPAWLRRTLPTGISNDVMGAVPRHPFFLRVIDSLQAYNRNWYLPYITVMYSTGPLFLSVIWKEYARDRPSGDDRVRILMPDEYCKTTWSFFTAHLGNSWHSKDAKLIFWMGRHWLFLTLLGFTLAGLIGTSVWWAYSRLLFPGGRCRPIIIHPGRLSRRFSPSRFRPSSRGKDDDDLVGPGHVARHHLV